MLSNNWLKGALFVAAGAASYGLLATFVKMAYQNGFTTPEVTFSQLSIGLLAMTLITLFKEKQKPATVVIVKKNDAFKLILAGTSLGLTSLFYYISVRYLHVSIAIVLLMQSTWISVMLEALIQKKAPSKQKIIAVLIVLIGTVLATNVWNTSIELDIVGFSFGFLAAISFSLTMFASNKIANYLPSYKKSNLMLLGGFFIILIYVLFSFQGSFNWRIFYTYGLFLAVFGTILPPLAFNIGFPLTGLGIGSIISALELPVSIGMAVLLLGEGILFWQIIGVLLILLAIVLMNIRLQTNKI